MESYFQVSFTALAQAKSLQCVQSRGLTYFTEMALIWI